MAGCDEALLFPPISCLNCGLLVDARGVVAVDPDGRASVGGTGGTFGEPECFGGLFDMLYDLLLVEVLVLGVGLGLALDPTPCVTGPPRSFRSSSSCLARRSGLNSVMSAKFMVSNPCVADPKLDLKLTSVRQVLEFGCILVNLARWCLIWMISQGQLLFECAN